MSDRRLNSCAAVTVPTGKVSTFMGSIGGTLPRIDIIRVPPAPPPGGDDWIARFGLEVVLDTADVASRAYFTSSF